jgi:hydrogenase maturation protease
LAANLSSLADVSSLVIGYGNPLRSDDGIGWHVAGRLAADSRLDGATILQRHQLTPELALDVSHADLVVLVDARSGSPAGSIATEPVNLEAARTTGTTWSHHLGPASLVALAMELYGRSGEVHVVSVGVGSLDLGETLSPLVADAVDRAVETVVALVETGPTAGSRATSGAAGA